MLKLNEAIKRAYIGEPAAFGRLCVETHNLSFRQIFQNQPPSGGCVLKRFIEDIAEQIGIQPPSGGCVLKLFFLGLSIHKSTSRLRAAVC